MVKFAGITPLTKALRSQSIWYSFVAGSTSATSLRLVIMGSRVMDAITRSWVANGLMPGPEICRSIFTNGLVDADDLRQRQDAALFQGLGLGGRLCAEIRQRQRDQYVGSGDQQADPEHPLQQPALARREVDRQKDGTDEAAADEHHDLSLDVTP